MLALGKLLELTLAGREPAQKIQLTADGVRLRWLGEGALEVTPPRVRHHRRIIPAYVAASQQPAQAARIAMRCNAFAATGPATRDGGIVFGHMTMFSLYPANFYNICKFFRFCLQGVA